MNLNIDFSGDTEALLRQTAAEAGKDIASFVREIVTERLKHRTSIPTARKRTHDEFMVAIREIIALHPKSNGKMNDSRESIYAGCGE